MNSCFTEDLFTAYFDARKNKRNTINALAFELNYESNLFRLAEEILARKYVISRSICFINFSPVQREIFAADFRDRIVHHLVFNYVNPIFDRGFINDSYSCRKGRGTYYGIKRVQRFISQCSRNYTSDCYIMKLDIEGYFMCMDKELLYYKIVHTLSKHKAELKCDYSLIVNLLKLIIFNDPTSNCIIKGKKKDWWGLPATKSLFAADEGKGLPIGNLTSQLFGNIYLDALDHYIKDELKIRYYGRYVDDLVLVHPDKEYLLHCRNEIKYYLRKNLLLNLHPKKFYLQYFTKGIPLLGVFIKPFRIYAGVRLKRNFYRRIEILNQKAILQDNILTYDDKIILRANVNSYLGLMKNYQTFKLRRNTISQFNTAGDNDLFFTSDLSKVVIPQKSVSKV